MAQPQWITDEGSLGKVAEGIFFNVPVQAVDSDGGTVKYSLIAGELPEGVQVTTNGTVEGVPRPYSKVQGVPTEVSEDVTAKFAIRASVIENGTTRINDRTFSITVTGQDVPEFVTPAGSLGTFYDGSAVDIDIKFTDQDPDDTVTVSLDSGELPPGITLSTTGNLSGHIQPVDPIPGTVLAGFDRENSWFDEYAFDFRSRSINKNYEFTLKISDGKDQNIRTFTMFVVSSDSLTADTTDFTADGNILTADLIPLRTPYINNYPTNGNIGTFRHDNFFAYEITATDLDGDPVEFEIESGDSGELPPNLIFDRQTGWLKGYFEDQRRYSAVYNFTITVYKKDDPTIVSEPYDYTITVAGEIENAVTWNVGTLVSGSTTIYSLGSIDNGDVSTLYISATAINGRALQYRLKPGDYPNVPGVYNKLPQGLKLLSSGEIAGRVSFNTFTLDSGTTTFDVENSTRLEIDPTTFDQQFDFTVEVYTSNELIKVERTFRIFVNRTYNSPYESLYIEAMPPQEDRDIITNILQNNDVIPTQSLYRANDPYFGLATGVKYVHAYSVDTASLYTYFEALQLNHFKKRLILGDIKTAQALDADENVMYEVVYADIVDSGVNKDGESPPQSVQMPYKFEDPDGSTLTKTVYPNSLTNMRDQVIDTVGQTNVVLPLWMSSKQANGRVLGFTKAWIIAYTKPGEGEKVAYNIRENFATDLNKVDFLVDRYILDKSLTKNWIVNEDSTDGGNFIEPLMTTFDFLEATGPDSTNLENATTFDGDSLRFNRPVDIYEFTDEYNKYLVFPKTNILE